MSWLDSMLGAISIAQSGSVVPHEPVLNFTGTGVAVTDNTSSGSTDVTITAGGGLTALHGDVTASGAGDVEAAVVGLNGHPIAATAPTNAQVLINNGSTWRPETVSQDATIANDGTLAIVALDGATPGTSDIIMRTGNKISGHGSGSVGDIISTSSGTITIGQISGTGAKINIYGGVNDNDITIQTDSSGFGPHLKNTQADGSITLTADNILAVPETASNALFRISGHLRARDANSNDFFIQASPYGAITLEQFGAVGDGITDDQEAFASALTLLSASSVIGTGPRAILLGANRSYLVTGGTLPAGCSIIGMGQSSVLKTVTNGPVITIGGQGTTCRGFQIFGNQAGINQSGIRNGTAGSSSSGFEDTIVSEIFFNSLTCGYEQNEFTLLSHRGATITNCRAYLSSYLGKGCFHSGPLAEYSRFIACEAHDSQIGFYVASANTQIIGCVSDNHNTYGIQITGSGVNSGHGIVVGCFFNHNETGSAIAIQIDDSGGAAITTGMFFSACNVYNGSITLKSCVGIRFANCTIDCDAYNFDGSTGTIFDDCLFPGATVNAINNSVGGHASTTHWMANNVDYTGSFPAFISANLDGTDWSTEVAGHLQVQKYLQLPGAGNHLSSTGDLRVTESFAIKARDNSNAADANLLSWSGAGGNVLSLGDGSGSFATSSIMQAYSYAEIVTVGGSSYFAVSVAGNFQQYTNANGIQLFTASADLGSGVGVVGIKNCTTAPTATPTTGGILYSQAGAGKWKGTSGTVTTFGPAEPHCEQCGSDFMTEHESPTYGYLAICLKCMADELGHRTWIKRTKG